MDFMKCKLCRESFFSYGSRLCPTCQEQIDKDFLVVREHIYDHPESTSVERIAEATGVNEKNIMYLLEEGRLTATGALASAMKRSCQVCGRSITSGTICEMCKSSLSRELGALTDSADSKKNKSSAAPTRSSSLISEYGKKK